MKYKLTNTVKDGLHQIEALIDIPSIGVRKGDRGGYIEKEANLSQEGNAWVYGDARVYDNAWVCGDALVHKKESIIIHQTEPYSVTITEQTISIGCENRSRFGAHQWKKSDPQATPELIKQYGPILKALRKQLPRKKTK
jgi:hypothetical protein